MKKTTILTIAVLFQTSSNVPAFHLHYTRVSADSQNLLFSEAAGNPRDSSETTDDTYNTVQQERNSKYVDGLLENLSKALDKWILTGSPLSKERVVNLLNMIKSQTNDPEDTEKATRMIRRAGLHLKEDSKVELGKTDEQTRRDEAERRRQWEGTRTRKLEEANRNVAEGRSALSRRTSTNEKPDLFLVEIDPNLQNVTKVAQDKLDLEKALSPNEQPRLFTLPTKEVDEVASATVSNLVAQAGAGPSFKGENLGIGGLDDVLAEVKRRVWTPLAAPPKLLHELGIQPVRGLLLYGRPGCGKTLLARKLGQILSPLRPYTLVSGPEILDKFVGSSEKNLRAIFDNPPGIYDFYRIGESDGGKGIEKVALHVIIMDEFDAIARSRGGRGGSGDQGDAGVARDSVVNQLLAKMDGVDPLPVPTMVIGLTNKRSLIDSALLRPGRFEVQIEVPPPRTLEQRISVLQVHTIHMQKAGRLLVKDAPVGSSAYRKSREFPDLVTYEELLRQLALRCKGFSGAQLAGVARAAASHALERAVEEFTQQPQHGSLSEECVVTLDDFELAFEDVTQTMDTSDWKKDDTESALSEDAKTD